MVLKKSIHLFSNMTFEARPEMTHKNLDYFSGFPKDAPYGAHPDGEGAHFSIFSRNAWRVWLAFFDSPQDHTPCCEIELDPVDNRTGDIWHVWVKGVGHGQLYLWRMEGPYDPQSGHLFDTEAFLLDPYAKALTGDFRWDDATPRHRDKPLAVRFSSNGGVKGMPKCIVCSDRFEWEKDRPLNHPLSETIIYECHVRGLTAQGNSDAKAPGTFAGVVEKIPYFKKLGITALELLPVHEFSVAQGIRKNPFTEKELTNYWGYNTVSFFAPNGRYSKSGNMGEQVSEFKYMVKELHKADIEVILDVVFNHTAEGGQDGPILCFKGLENSIYYLLNKKTGDYLDYTGCGNTMNCNHPVVREFILSCLKYWVLHMHVDGFRFDLASVLGRDEKGNLLPNPPLLAAIEQDPMLRGTKVIAEAWDAAGAYQVGEFTGRWAEWNGKFRDDVRRFWKGNPKSLGPFATRLSGSSDLYGDDRTPHHSINFVTSHDGFPLIDWASYEKKHNLANGEDNQDGDNHNLSLNHGHEGPTKDKKIDLLRKRQAKNMYTSLLLSLGVPMVLGGDEFLRTQQGNNNAYCQDNEISWFDWELINKNAEMVRFATELIAFRKRHPSLHRPDFFTGKPKADGTGPDIIWFGQNGKKVNWENGQLALAALIDGHYKDRAIHSDKDIFLMFNAQDNETWFEVPKSINGGEWKIALDTGLDAPLDIYPQGEEPFLKEKKRYHLVGKSTAVLIASCKSCDQ